MIQHILTWKPFTVQGIAVRVKLTKFVQSHELCKQHKQLPYSEMRSTQQTFTARETYLGPLAPLAAALLAMATDVLDVLEDAIALDEIQAAAEAAKRPRQLQNKNWKSPHRSCRFM